SRYPSVPSPRLSGGPARAWRLLRICLPFTSTGGKHACKIPGPAKGGGRCAVGQARRHEGRRTEGRVEINVQVDERKRTGRRGVDQAQGRARAHIEILIADKGAASAAGVPAALFRRTPIA